MNLKDLQKKIPFKWRIQSVTKDGEKASCVAYIDARDVEKLLDSVCAPENWQNKYYEVKGTLCCMIGIKCGSEWIWKSDGGSESNVEKVKGELSDAFKRAAVKWGVGRFLYNEKIQWVQVNQYKQPVKPDGSRIWDLTQWVNSLERHEAR